MVIAANKVKVGLFRQQLAKLLRESSHIEEHLHVEDGKNLIVLSPQRQIGRSEAFAPKKVINLLKIYPELPSEARVNDREQVTVEVIRGTAVNSVKF